MDTFSVKDNQLLDRILSERHTTRSFKDVAPDKELIEEVLNAGMISPYASISSNDIEIFRHFYVIPKGNPLLEKINSLISSQTSEDLEQFNRLQQSDPLIKKYGEGYGRMLANVSKNGLPGFVDVPCLIIAAEWRGARKAEKQSLAHAMQNMWLKATALNLGFQLVSPIESMTWNQEFNGIFGYEPGLYGFHGCVLGYPTENKRITKPIHGAITWF
ncbi:MAG: nitroreductase family protein [Clostridiales bacterium]|nr:nitroreductase family protein [Clostridiales bacterium]